MKACCRTRLAATFAAGRPKPFYYFTVFDGHRKEASSARGAKLGELVRDTYNYRGVFRDVVDFADGLWNNAT